MLFDFRELDNKSIEADLCIVGAGAAGITMARRLAGSGMRVCVLESGGLEFDEENHALYAGTDTGFNQGPGVSNSRLRYLGGATNHWVGHCAPYSKMDFEARPWIPYSGWPIRKHDLDPYYVLAQEVMEIGPYQYDLAEITATKDRLPPFDIHKILARCWQMSPPTRFGTRYRSDLEQASNISVFLHANVTELETGKDVSRVTTARIRTLDGHTGYARAKYFVVACGGIENARLLLLSNSKEPKGLGNQHDVVGRFYLDHLRVDSAATAYVDNNSVFEPVSDTFKTAGVSYKPMLCPSGKAQKRDETLNWCAQISTVAFRKEAWLLAARDIRDDLRAGKWPDDFADKAWAVISDLDSVARGLYSRTKPRPLRILGRCEGTPDPESRITLTSERDALGQHKVQRNWRVSGLEKHTLRSGMRLLGEEFGRLGLGRVKLPEWLMEDNNEWPEPQWGVGVHHLGTTRMAADPRRGVVDANCRVHTTENLFISGGSVFPTSGYTHPTLTVCAMALRLADHLKSLFHG